MILRLDEGTLFIGSSEGKIEFKVRRGTTPNSVVLEHYAPGISRPPAYASLLNQAKVLLEAQGYPVKVSGE